MGKSGYLKMVGSLEIVGFLVATITYVISMFLTFGTLNTLGKVLMLVTFFMLILLGPAVGVLFLTVADHEAWINPISHKSQEMPSSSPTKAKPSNKPLSLDQAEQKREIVNTLFTKGVIDEKERDERLKQIEENIEK